MAGSRYEWREAGTSTGKQWDQSPDMVGALMH